LVKRVKTQQKDRKKPKEDREKKIRRLSKVATTQLQATPTLYGKDARAVLEQLDKELTPEQKKKLEKEREFFDSIKKRGLK